jgi:hypothetical protein
LNNDTLDIGPETLHCVSCCLTRHAAERMARRGIRLAAVLAALRYGREVYTRGAFLYGIGRKEVDLYRRLGIDLAAYAGVQVVCSPDGAILTAYRNPNLRALRPRLGRRHSRMGRRTRSAGSSRGSPG